MHRSNEKSRRCSSVSPHLIVDCFARWGISDSLLYYNRLNDERNALSRPDDILGSETRTAVATHHLVEIIRVIKGRQPLRDPELEKSGTVLPSKPDAQDLYLFMRSLDVARSAFEHDTTAVISTNSDLGRVLKNMSGTPLFPTKTAGQ